MKLENKRILSIIATAMLLVCVYQLYWLIGQYNELKLRLGEDIQEALRSADFEELVHRVDEISKMDFQGRVDVNVGYDNKEKQSYVNTEINENIDPEPSRGTQTIVSPSTFGSVLKKPEDLIQIGLNMQRGIHSSLDGMKEVDLGYLDKIISIKLDSLGLSGEHQLLYLKKNEQMASPDTLAKLGIMTSEPTDVFSLPLSADSEYRMIIPQWHFTVVRKMTPIILFSICTLLLLIGTFGYLICIMRKQREVEEIKTDFTNNITHELKTPIAVAYAANDALLNFNSASNTPRMNRYLTVCQEQLRLLDRLVEQILSLSMERKKSMILNFENVGIREVLESLAGTFRMKYNGKVDFNIITNEGLSLRTDRMHLSNIVGNLIDNAIKYSLGEAKVTLKAYRDKNGHNIIEVSDEGIGITNDQQKLIFDKFYRVPHGNVHDVKGYGLGLFYVKSMTEKLGGEVNVKSTLGKGSCFRLDFKQHDRNE